MSSEKEFFIHLFSNADNNRYKNRLTHFTVTLDKPLTIAHPSNLYVGLAKFFLPTFSSPIYTESTLQSLDCIFFEKYKDSEKEINTARKEYVLDKVSEIVDKKKKETVSIDVFNIDPVVYKGETSVENEDDSEEEEEDNERDGETSKKKQKMVVGDPEREWYYEFQGTLSSNNSLWTIEGFCKFLLSKTLNLTVYSDNYFTSLFDPNLYLSHKNSENILGDKIEVDVDDYYEFIFDCEEILDHSIDEQMSYYFPFFSLDVWTKQREFFKQVKLKLNKNYPYKLKEIFIELIHCLLERVSKFYDNEANIATTQKRITLREFYDLLYQERKKNDHMQIMNSKVPYSEMIELHNTEIERKQQYIKRFMIFFKTKFLEEKEKMIIDRGNQIDENHFIFIHTNIVHSSQVGDKLVQILDVIPCKTSVQGKTITYEPKNILYKKVLDGTINEIQIAISHESGAWVNVIPSVIPTHIALHFKHL